MVAEATWADLASYPQLVEPKFPGQCPYYGFRRKIFTGYKLDIHSDALAAPQPLPGSIHSHIHS
jgi:hypothetical protein